MPDLTKTRAELVNRALGRLGVVGAGQTVSSEDYDTVDDLVDAVLLDLAARRVYIVDDEEEIPTEASEYIAAILAQAAAMDFQKQTQPQVIEWAERKLRQLSAPLPTGEVLVAKYY